MGAIDIALERPDGDEQPGDQPAVIGMLESNSMAATVSSFASDRVIELL